MEWLVLIRIIKTQEVVINNLMIFLTFLKCLFQENKMDKIFLKIKDKILEDLNLEVLLLKELKKFLTNFLERILLELLVLEVLMMMMISFQIFLDKKEIRNKTNRKNNKA